MQESIVFLVRVQCRRKESTRSLSHLLMSFLSTAVEFSVQCPVNVPFCQKTSYVSVTFTVSQFLFK